MPTKIYLGPDIPFADHRISFILEGILLGNRPSREEPVGINQCSSICSTTQVISISNFKLLVSFSFFL